MVIVCYRAVDLTIDCLLSLEPEKRARPGIKVAICENGTGGDAATKLAEAIEREGWDDFASVTVIYPNRGFSGSNNVILQSDLLQKSRPDYVLLLNADTVVREKAIDELVRMAEARPDLGIIGPRLEWPDGTPQVSHFRFMSPLSEFLSSAATGHSLGSDNKSTTYSNSL